MGIEEQRQTILRYLSETEAAQPSAVIYRNLRVRGLTVSKETIRRRLGEMADEEEITRVDPKAMGNHGVLRPIEGEERQLVYYTVLD